MMRPGMHPKQEDGQRPTVPSAGMGIYMNEIDAQLTDAPQTDAVVVALYDYVANSRDELSFKKNDIFLFVERYLLALNGLIE